MAQGLVDLGMLGELLGPFGVLRFGIGLRFGLGRDSWREAMAENRGASHLGQPDLNLKATCQKPARKRIHMSPLSMTSGLPGGISDWPANLAK